MTSSTNGSSPVTVFDQEWPDFTLDRAALRPSVDGDQTPNVTGVLRDVLGWRPVASDPKAFTAALQASFALTAVEGHVESAYQPRGFAMQADLGAVSGGQASLYARATASLTHIRELLDGVTPLRPDFDSEDGSASRTLISAQLTTIVGEMGAAGGPRTALIDASFQVLVGRGTDRTALTGDTVGGQLGRLRDRFGLTADNVNTVEEERIRTSYWTLVDQVIDLDRAWENWKGLLGGFGGAGFLGTDLVLISRLLEATSEQIDEYEAVLDSVLIGAAERQTIWLDEPTHLTLDGLLSWLRTFVRTDGPAYLRDSGRDGLATAFLPTASKLVEVYTTILMPFASRTDAPRGLKAARAKVAAESLQKLLVQVQSQAAQASPTADLQALNVTISHVTNTTAEGAPAEGKGDGARRLLVEVRARGARPGLMCAFAKDDDVLVLPIFGTETVNDDMVTGEFVATEAIAPMPLLTRQGKRVFEASAVPLRILEAATGEVVWRNGLTSWPQVRPSWSAPDPSVNAVPAWRRAAKYDTSF